MMFEQAKNVHPIDLLGRAVMALVAALAESTASPADRLGAETELYRGLEKLCAGQAKLREDISPTR